MVTSTIYTTFEKLTARGDEAVLIVKLMMAFNDLALANEGLSIFKSQYVTKRNDKNRGAAMYFVRLQASHLYEAMEIVDVIAANQPFAMLSVDVLKRLRSHFKGFWTYVTTKTNNKNLSSGLGGYGTISRSTMTNQAI